MHGYGSKKESFYYQIKYFSQYFKVTAPDFPAFGASSPIDRAWSVGDYADWLKAFYKKAGLSRPHILAHSFGARVALKLLAEDCGYADKLVITGGAGLVKPRSAAYMRRVKRYRLVKRFFPKYAERHFGSKEYRSLSPIMKESYKLIVNEDLSGCAKAVKNPTLLIYGSGDTVTPIFEEGATFNRLICGSKLVEMAGTHFCFCEDYDFFNDTVERFLQP